MQKKFSSFIKYGTKILELLLLLITFSQKIKSARFSSFLLFLRNCCRLTSKTATFRLNFSFPSHKNVIKIQLLIDFW